MASALVRAGHRVTIGTRADLETPAAQADLILITVADDALPEVVARLVTVATPGQCFAHTSGASGTEVLDPLTRLATLPMAVHPVMTFAGGTADVRRLTSGIVFGVTAAEAARPWARRLVGDLGGTIEWIQEEQRALYHAAMVTGANFLVTLVNDAVQLLRQSGVGRPEAMLAPLLTAALGNCLELGDVALTGPVARGDAGTVGEHLAVLRSMAPDLLSAYTAMANRTVRRARAAGLLDSRQHERLLRTLRAAEDRSQEATP